MSSDESDAEKFFLQLKQDFLDKRSHLLYLPVSVQQKKTSVDFPARGAAQVSRDLALAPSDDSLIKIIMSAIHDLGDSTEIIPAPTLENVNVQWSSYRDGALRNESEPFISERDKFHRLSKYKSQRPVIFYAHGGFYCTGGPATSRRLTTMLAKSMNGRCFVLDHRLCPQNPFPAALLDALLSYLTLLYPRSENHHDPIDAKDIVFAGESAGGNLLVSLLLIIKHIHEKHGGRIMFFEREVKVPFPAGFACVGCQFDTTISFGFTDENSKYDFLLPEPPTLSTRMPKCDVWPSKPPRGDVSCDVTALCHPLISPIASPNWRLLPHMFLAYGEEYLNREGKSVARRATIDGVIVEFHRYRKLFHCFHLMHPELPQSKHVVNEIARFAQDCVFRPEAMSSRNLEHPANLQNVAERDIGLPFEDTEGLSFEEMVQRMRMYQRKRKVWNGPDEKASSSRL